ncbi:C-type lectin 1-like [Astyanax mexicanus]|uniref:C-type lectin 1-like n=1 Tax=Astyanax mexicanus TaxID=7994 RepID=A0A8T2KJI7_ASTMX|nr:C-type lectin 1-like [Astyanax mexicanus]
MEMRLLYMLLVTGVLQTLSSGLYEYHLITDQKNWTDAQAYCREHYVDLATVENDLDFGRIQREAQRLSFTSEAWVGLYNDINSWRCSRDEVPLGSWSKWQTDQPNNVFGKDQCVIIFQDKRWYDISCSSKHSFICYDETISSPEKFVYYTDQKTWMEAQDFCRQRHTDLACPTNSNEELLLEKTFIYGWTWIGFFRDGWKWSDKSNSSDVRWFTDQPNNAGGKDNCGYVVKSVFSNGGTSAGLFDDGSCSNQRAFFCQYVPKNTQVMRLVVHSSQDMNDPTVQADLLENMQQKLMEQWMVENTTLQWKKHSDGSVFYKQKEKRKKNEKEKNTTSVCEM